MKLQGTSGLCGRPQHDCVAPQTCELDVVAVCPLHDGERAVKAAEGVMVRFLVGGAVEWTGDVRVTNFIIPPRPAGLYRGARQLPVGI